MFDGIKKILNKIRHLNDSLDNYAKDSVVQAMPSLAFVNRAKKFIEKKEFDEAEKILLEAVNLPQEDPLVYKYLGMIYERTGRIQDAVDSYKKAAKIDKNDKEIWRMLGFVLVNSGKNEEAEESFENANKITPMNTDVFAGWGMALMKQKRYHEAHEKFMEAVKINRYNLMALLLAAIMEVRTGQYNDAEAKLSFLANVSPNETNNYEYANLKYIREDYDNAIHYAKKAIEFNANMLPAYLLLGKLYVIKGEKELSLKMYKEAFERELLTQHLFYDWGVTLQIYNEFQEAKEKFEKAVSLSEGDSETNAGLALSLAGLGNIEEAENIINEISNLNESNYIFSKAKALIAIKKQDFNKAIELLKSVQNQISFDTSLNYYIAYSYENMGDTNNAKEYFEKALVENPSDINVYTQYSKLLIQIEDFENAKRKLQRAHKLAENDLEILNLLFHVSYKLVIENNSEYNIREALTVADKINAISEDSLKYPEEYIDLKNMCK